MHGKGAGPGKHSFIEYIRRLLLDWRSPELTALWGVYRFELLRLMIEHYQFLVVDGDQVKLRIGDVQKGEVRLEPVVPLGICPWLPVYLPQLRIYEAYPVLRQ